jgi:hypothetical protein
MRFQATRLLGRRRSILDLPRWMMVDDSDIAAPEVRSLLGPPAALFKLTHHPHLRLGVVRRELEVMESVPKAVNSIMGGILIDLDEDSVWQLTSRVVKT